MSHASLRESGPLRIHSKAPRRPERPRGAFSCRRGQWLLSRIEAMIPVATAART